MAHCKLCKSEYREQIESFICQGYSERYCVNWLKEKGERFTVDQIKRHILSHTELVVKLDSKAPKKREKEGEVKKNTEEVNKQASDLKLTLPNIPEDIEFSELVMMVQDSVGKIFLKQASIVSQCQELYVNGLIKHPTEQIRSLKYLADVLNLAWSYETGVNLSRAFQVLEAEGYTITEGLEGELRVDLALGPQKSAKPETEDKEKPS